jgi:hypothetical protein
MGKQKKSTYTEGTHTVKLRVKDSHSLWSSWTSVAFTVKKFTPVTVKFTNAGATGRYGPTQSQVNSAYSGTVLAGKVTIRTRGIQEWTVPHTGTYRITATGAQGGSRVGTGGKGAIIRGDVYLTEGTVLKIIMGQEGGNDGSGGGGSNLYNGGRGGYNGGDGHNSSIATGGGSFIHANTTNVATSDARHNNKTSHNGSISNLGSWNSGNGYVEITRVK